MILGCEFLIELLPFLELDPERTRVLSMLLMQSYIQVVYSSGITPLLSGGKSVLRLGDGF